MREAIFKCVDIVNMRNEIVQQYANPLKKRSAFVLRNVVDEKIILE